MHLFDLQVNTKYQHIFFERFFFIPFCMLFLNQGAGFKTLRQNTLL